MENNYSQTPSDPVDSELDIKAILLRLWDKRRFILIVVGVISAWGLIVAVCQKKEYKSSCTFVPQFSSPEQALSLYSSFTAMLSTQALESVLSGETMSPLVYPQLLDNVEFNKELMNIPLHFAKYSESVSLYQYYTDPKYKQFDFVAQVKKWTVDIPKRIINKFKREEPDVTMPADAKKTISKYSKQEYNIAQNISGMLELRIDKKEFFYELSSTFSDPLACADLCQKTLELLGKYITEFKISHAQQNLEFMKELNAETESRYKAAQLALAKYVDSNRGALTATTQVRKEQLTADYELALSAFSETSRQLLMAEVKVREDTPVFSAINPVSIPNKKSNSRMKTFAVYVFVGLVLACGTVIGLDWIKAQGWGWPKWWK